MTTMTSKNSNHSEMARREVADQIRVVMQKGWVLTDERFDALVNRLASIVQIPAYEAHRAAEIPSEGSRRPLP